MSELRELSSLVWRRQAAAAARISELMDGALADYKKQISRLKKDNKRQRKLLDALLHPGARLFPTVLPKQLLLNKEEKQEWSPSVDQEQPEPPHVKEEQQELWASQEAEQLQDIKFPFTDVTVKSEDDGEEAARNVDPAADFHPASNGQLLSSHSSDSETDDSEHYVEEAGESQSGSSSVSEVLVSLGRSDVIEKPSSSSVNKNTRVQQWKCHVCGSSFKKRQKLNKHMRMHKREKPFSCPFCALRFSHKRSLNRHIRNHIGEKPFSCSECHKSFSDKRILERHLRVHTGERPFTCSVCHKGFRDKPSVKVHMRVHTGEKPFSCSECDKSFSDKRILQRHMKVHTEERPFSCSVCHKGFKDKPSVKVHMRLHTGEKPFSCSECDKRFSDKRVLQRHMKVHTEERPLSCSVSE
ncbi:zinc finger protein 501-like isoform X1 [Myripristis murdjan]|uniref:Zinc finger protein 501-like n=1 Tax=Myripristis murdjan TaxID=586833 RepID=A0A667Z751_9TELE|nr:zinc finger protein 501-like isoform X1 [Myripristis murdjan]